MTRNARPRPLALVLLLLVALAAACGDDATTDTVADPTDGTGDGGGGNEVVVQVEVGGGFTTPNVAMSTIPQLTVLADGTVLTPGIIPLSYPGPALTPVQAGTLDPGGLDELLGRARELGLLDGPLDFGEPAIADAPTTVVTIVVDGVAHRHMAYALDFGPDTSGVGEAASANRQALATFVTDAQGLAVGDRMWDPPAIVVTVIGPAQPGEPEEPAVAWPLATAPETAGDFPCTLVEGSDVAPLLDALAGANELTPWTIDGADYSVAFRPLVPGDSGCA